MGRHFTLPAAVLDVDIESLYKRHGNHKYGVRLLALHRLKSGDSLKKVGLFLLKSVNTIKDWVQLFCEGGLEALLSIRAGRGRKSKLSQEQDSELKQLLSQKHESLNGGRLRGYDIKNIIEEEFGAKYALRGVYHLLHRLKYSWITSRSIHPKADPQAQENFKK